MKVDELITKLLEFPKDAEVTVDVDDGVKGSYHDVINVRVVIPPIGDAFVALDSDYTEQNKGTPIGG